MFTRFPYLRKRPYWGNHFWAKGYCVDTVGVDATMIRKYVKYQEKQELSQQKARVEDGKITEYLVTLRVIFVLENPDD